MSDDHPTDEQQHTPAGGVSLHPSARRPVGRRKGPRWGAIVAILAAVGVVAAVSAFGLAHDPSEARPVLIGKQAPSFEARTLDGSRTVRLRDLRGQVVVLNFWSSWCSACIAEHEALTRAWTRFRDRGVVVAGMDFDDARGAAVAFAERLGIGYPVLADPGDRTALAYGVAAPPETFLIGPGGRIESKWVGPVPYDELAARIDSLLESGR